MKITEMKNYIYNDEYESFCFHNCVKQILSYYGLENPNFYINMSFMFRIRIEKNELTILDNNASYLLPEFNDMLSRFYYCEEFSRERVWNVNYQVIKAGQPIIAGVDSYYLNYFPTYKKNHGRHNVIVDDYDKNTNMVSILDWIKPWFFRGEILLDEFLDARSSLNEADGKIYSGVPILNNWAIIYRRSITQDIRHLVLSQIILTYNQYFIKENIKNEYNGIYATMQLKKYFEELLQYNDEEIMEVLKTLHDPLYVINRRRDLFKLCLYEAGSLLGNEALSNLSNETLNLYSIWEKLSFLIVRASLRLRSDSINKLINLLNEITNMEEHYKHLLEDAIQMLKR